MKLLEIHDLNVRYGGITALHKLSLSIKVGETVMITGPNGAGKAPLLKTIAGLVKPQHGSVVFDGQLITGRAPETIAAAGFSMVPEGRQVFNSLTVLENLRVGTGMRRNKLAVAADLDYVMDVFPVLRERALSQAGMLSGGQQQMLVIDEPSLGLAPLVTDQVYEALMRLRVERELTLLIVEQSASRAVMTGGRMLMLREGRIVLEGDPRELTAHQMQQAYFGYEDEPATASTP